MPSVGAFNVHYILNTGAMLEIIPANNIFENSTLSRELCVRLINYFSGLQRSIHINIVFVENSFPFAEASKHTLYKALLRNQICNNCNLLFAGDFVINSSAVYYNSSSVVNDTRCFVFTPVDDNRAEADERFYFNISTTNTLDTITSNQALVDITIYDEDGKSSI